MLAPLGSAFGEALHAVRIARALVATGDDVVLLAPAALETAIADAPITFGRIDRVLPRLDLEVTAELRRLRCDSLVLVDLAAVDKVVRAFGLELSAFLDATVPVVALDCWDLPPTPVDWAYGTHGERTSAASHAFARRLVPVPIARPTTRGAFDALPTLGPASQTARATLRAELGIPPGDKLVLWPTATWQHGANQTDPALAQLADALPTWILPLLAGVDARVHVVHVGPRRFTHAWAFTAPYRYLGQVPPHRFEAIVAAADLVLGFNAVATSLATAIAVRTPVVLGHTRAHLDALPDVERALGAHLSPALRDALAANLPLAPIHAWPLRLGAVIEPALADNPLVAAVERVDLFDPVAYTAACSRLLTSAGADEQRERQTNYARIVRALPAAHDRLRELLREG